MRRQFAAAACGSLLAVAAVAPAHAQEIVDTSSYWPTAQTLMTAERAAWDIYQRRDTAAPDLLSSDYVEVLPGGEVGDRASHLAMIPEADLSAYSLEGLRVIRLTDDAMLVTYEADWTDGAGETGRVAVTSGWARRDGRWMNVFYRETPLG